MSYYDEYELTGYEEHLHFMAGAEDLDLRAMRAEADMNSFYEAEEAFRLDEEAAQQANPLTALCAWQCPYNTDFCRLRSEDDDIPF